ncbi:hypothetical protein [Terrihabitans sp. B22-R8]|uniref:hypothetical protein n=1 Tax=Terrihabitans sp. B22-R8 TaxID=3425128 RepID=UPI00403D1978
MKPLKALPVLLLPLLCGANPASSQYNNLDIHLDQQLSNRLQDHQNAERRRPPRKKAERPAPGPDAIVIRRLQQNIKRLEAGIPQGRRIEVAKDGTVHIHVVGHVDEKAVIAFAESVLETRVVVKRVP